MTQILATLRDSHPGPGIAPEALIEAAKTIAIERGYQPGDMGGVVFVLACIASGAMVGGIYRFPAGRRVELNLDHEEPVA